MKRGHVTGTKRERQGSQEWYHATQAAHLARIEAAWAANPSHTPRAYATMALACGSTLDLSNATQAELEALVREYLAYMATIAQN